MADEKTDVRELDYRRLFPWIELFRSFRIALDPKKLVLAALGLCAMSVGWYAISAVLQPRVGIDAQVFQEWPWEQGTGYKTLSAKADEGGLFGMAHRIISEPHKLFEEVATNWPVVLRPAQTLTRPFAWMFDIEAEWSKLLMVVLCALWAAAVWGFFGGAITRIAAVQVARDERVGLMAACKFAVSKFLSFFAAPLFPLVGVAFFTVFCMVGGWVALAWYPGAFLAGALWGLPLVAGFVMVIIALGLAVGWPLMYATISAEGSDSFDALSRSYSYVYQRPWHYLFYALVAAVYGSLVIFFVVLITQFVAYFSQWSVSMGAGKEAVRDLFAAAPKGDDWWAAFSGKDYADLLGPRKVGAVLTAAWLQILFMLMVGFIYSYFWSATTVIYFLLRKNVDATDMDEVYLEEEEEEQPLGGPGGEESKLPIVQGTEAGAANPSGSHEAGGGGGGPSGTV